MANGGWRLLGAVHLAYWAMDHLVADLGLDRSWYARRGTDSRPGRACLSMTPTSRCGLSTSRLSANGNVCSSGTLDEPTRCYQDRRATCVCTWLGLGPGLGHAGIGWGWGMEIGGGEPVDYPGTSSTCADASASSCTETDSTGQQVLQVGLHKAVEAAGPETRDQRPGARSQEPGARRSSRPTPRLRPRPRSTSTTRQTSARPDRAWPPSR